MTATVFDIQKFSVHDGYGIRTTVFFKGCNCRCLWCHNPEGLMKKPQLRFLPIKCMGCGRCAAACPNGCFDGGEFDFSKCIACGKCAEVCCTGAREICGKEMTADEVFQAVLKDKQFYKNSGGGVTFSGGEPLLWADFIVEVSKKCVDNGISVGIQTAANVPFSEFEKLIPYVSFFMCDFKAFDNDIHKKYVGVGNELIKENLIKLSQTDTRLIVRTPVVPGVNSSTAEIESICRFISDFKNLDYYELLKYHPYGLGKLKQVNMDCCREFEVPETSKMRELYDVASKYIKSVKCDLED